MVPRTVALFVAAGFLIAGERSHAIEPDPTQRAMIKGWYSISTDFEGIEWCILGPDPRLLHEIDDFDECAVRSVKDDGENFDLTLYCSDESPTATARLTGRSKPGELSVHAIYIDPEILAMADDEDVTTITLQRLRDCSEKEEAAARAAKEPKRRSEAIEPRAPPAAKPDDTR